MLAPHATPDDMLGDDPAYRLAPEHAAVFTALDEGEQERLVGRASELVDELTRCAHYQVDEEGRAVDENVAAGLRMATCAVVEMWLEVGEDNDVDGLAGTQVSVSGFSGLRTPEATRRVLRPLRRVGLLAQPGVLENGELL